MQVHLLPPCVQRNACLRQQHMQAVLVLWLLPAEQRTLGRPTLAPVMLPELTLRVMTVALERMLNSDCTDGSLWAQTLHANLSRSKADCRMSRHCCIRRHQKCSVARAVTTDPRSPHSLKACCYFLAQSAARLHGCCYAKPRTVHLDTVSKASSAAASTASHNLYRCLPRGASLLQSSLCPASKFASA